MANAFPSGIPVIRGEFENGQINSVILADGRSIVFFSNDNPPGDINPYSSTPDPGYDIYGQLYSVGGQPINSPFVINQTTFHTQDYPRALQFLDGSYVVVWSLSQYGSVFGAVYQRFDNEGQAVGGEVIISTRDAPIGTIELTSTGGGGFDISIGRTGEYFSVGTDPYFSSAIQGQVLTADVSEISDTDGLGEFSYVWMRDGMPIAGATGSDYRLTQSDVDSEISLQVTYIDGGGTIETVTSQPTAPVFNINEKPEGVVTISGEATQGETVIADTSGLIDPDGLGEFSYVWMRDGMPIAGVMGSDYRLTQSDVDSEISLQVTYIDGGGTIETVTSQPTAPVFNINEKPEGVVTICGNATQGEVLRAMTHTLSDPDGLGEFSYVWMRDGMPIAGVMGSDYRLTQSDVGRKISLQVNYIDGEETLETKTSELTPRIERTYESPSIFSYINGLSGFSFSASDFGPIYGRDFAVGDINGDWIDDLILSNDTTSSEFGIHILYGNSNGFDPVIDLSVLDGQSGFSIRASGPISSGGDINGDGIDDILIGGFSEGSLILFGGNTLQSLGVYTPTANGLNGFYIRSLQWQDGLGGSSVFADINGDGIDDIVLAAASRILGDDHSIGEAYVIFGRSSGFSANFELSNLNGENGFIIPGVYAGGGLKVSRIGDINGDGIDDVQIETFDNSDGSTEIYIVFGAQDSFSSTFDLSGIDGSNGFIFRDYGARFWSAGDVNSDGFDDIIVTGGPNQRQDPQGLFYKGNDIFVLYGGPDPYSATMNFTSLNSSNSSRIGGLNNWAHVTQARGAGDVNGDGIDDVVIGAAKNGLFGGSGGSEVFVVFGAFDANSRDVDLSRLDKDEGFVLVDFPGNEFLNAARPNFLLEVDGLGDVNGDGINDIYVATPRAYGAENYVIMGSSNGNTGTNEADNIEGTVYGEVIKSFGGDDTIRGALGNDHIDGGSGRDIATFSGSQESFTVTLSQSSVVVFDRRVEGGGRDRILNVELLDFDENILGSAFDLEKFAGSVELSSEQLEQVIELYIAYFGRAPDAVGLNFWATSYWNCTTLEEMASLFIDQDETRATYPSALTNADFAAAVYINVLGRIADPAGFDFWVGLLDTNVVARDAFILEVLRGAKANPPPGVTQDFIDQQLADRAYLENKIDIGAYFSVHKGMSDVENASAAMALYDGSEASITDAVNAIDVFFADALDPTEGEFLLPLIGVLDMPDWA